ncbi:hypothetical protein PBY51_015657 [Eleginops maclovinus]|uniref:Uncharacterized protein n=1 Tax=Eleginops maclovinus TaxID=56733 RepID=A0AAN7XNN0_ELEMC|nr:hypothetical protein PBY51_015657 [Eleginops maclovinus]
MATARGEGEPRNSWTRLDAGNGYGVTGQRHGPHSTLKAQGSGILQSGKDSRWMGGGFIQRLKGHHSIM